MSEIAERAQNYNEFLDWLEDYRSEILEKGRDIERGAETDTSYDELAELFARSLGLDYNPQGISDSKVFEQEIETIYDDVRRNVI